MKITTMISSEVEVIMKTKITINREFEDTLGDPELRMFLLQLAETAATPTLRQYFQEMAESIRQEINREAVDTSVCERKNGNEE